MLSPNPRKFIRLCRFVADLLYEYCLNTGDLPCYPWRGAPVWFKNAHAECVDFVINRMDDDDIPEACEIHAHWVTVMCDNDWSWGNNYCEEKKNHPGLIVFRDLPFGGKVKYELFLAAILAGINLLEETNCANEPRL